jgi:anaerobic ribonucleoside-triphosphate reductase
MKYLKTYNESYTTDIIDECDSIILDIKDMAYDLQDLGFNVKVDYSISTKKLLDKTPKIMVYILGQDSLFSDENYANEILSFIESIKKYVSDLGFSTGGHFSTTTAPADNSFAGLTKWMEYTLVIQQ